MADKKSKSEIDEQTKFKIHWKHKAPRIDNHTQTTLVQGKAAKKSTVKELRADPSIEVVRVEQKKPGAWFWWGTSPR
jgi:hypothetical protein